MVSAGVASAVTALFVPGDRPDRYAKAAAAGPDLVIIDLEDAVADDRKDVARMAAFGALSSGRLRALVRINAADAAAAERDLIALVELTTHAGSGLAGVMLPKAEDPDAVAEVVTRLGRGPAGPVPVVLLIESALGVVGLPQLLGVRGVTRTALGALDLTLDLDCTADSATLAAVRAQLVVSARAAGSPPPLDSPSTEIAEEAVVAAAAGRARADGFGGMLCIHPRQLAAVRAAFAPTAAELDWARSVLDAGESATQISGRMIDRPIVERARRLIARSPSE